MIIHEHPDAAVRAKADYLLGLKKDKTFWALVAQLCKTDPWFLARVVLKLSWLDEDLHGRRVLGFYNENSGNDRAMFIPRGFGKTLCTAVDLIQVILNNPNVSVLFASATDALASKFAKYVANELMYNYYLQQAFGVNSEFALPENKILPSCPGDTESWSMDSGYTICRKQGRIDPTIFAGSLKTNVTGSHPDLAYLDDLVVAENNNETGWEKARGFIKEVKMLIPAQGVIRINGTRWHDADPYGDIIGGRIIGKSGRPFAVMLEACWQDDDPKKPILYPAAKRWGMDTVTGYTKEQIDAMRGPEDQGGLGVYFDAQMRNDPAPAERQDIQVSDINIYEKDQLPALSLPRVMGIEITGGGRLIYQRLQEMCEELRFFIPLAEVSTIRKQGEDKSDRIRAALEPIVRNGHLFCQKWMIGEPSAQDTLGYEIRRLGVARHDDIVDALHNVPVHLVRGSKPPEDSPEADLYISVDTAYTADKRSDFTVAAAVAVDPKGNYWVADYDRFQLSSPTAICDRLIKFYRKWLPPEGGDRPRGRRFNIGASYK